VDPLPTPNNERVPTLASRSGRRPASRSTSRRTKIAIKPGAAEASEPNRGEIIERTARLGITSERVRQEYARIAVADPRRVADWGPDGLVLKTPEALTDADAAAISEITTAGAGSRQYRVKFYDKKAALDAIARHLSMFVPAAPRADGDIPEDLAEDARDELARRLARLAAGGAEE
jgi:Terminase small subunit